MSRQETKFEVVKVLVVVFVGCVLFFGGRVWSEDPVLTAVGAEASVEKVAAEPAAKVFEPYLGKITGDEVNIRSGPAQIYYAVCRVRKGQEVIVCEERRGKADWAMIEATDACFSYISKEYVRLTEVMTSAEPVLDAEGVKSEAAAAPVADATESGNEPLEGGLDALVGKEPVLGVVTGSRIRVRAGSIKVPPANANQVQVKLNEGDVVQIIGQRDDYYKIVCPEKCYFWVSLDFVERIGQLSSQKRQELLGQKGGAILDGTVVVEESVPSVPLSAAEQEREEYRAIAKLFEAEQVKPLVQRNFQVIKESIEKLMAGSQQPRIKRSAASLLRKLAHAEWIQNRLKKSLAMDESLRVTLAKIDRKKELLMSISNPVGKTEKDTVVIGRLAMSSVFTAPNKNRPFLVLDDNEKIIYYAVAGVEDLELDRWVGKKISMVGTAKFDSFGKGRVLEVTGVVELPGQ